MAPKPKLDPTKMPDPTFEPPTDEVLTPEVPEGWRSWSISGNVPKFGADPKLYSVAGTKGYYWIPKRESIAECRKGCTDDQIPRSGCTCGFYSARTLEHLMGMRYHVYDGERSGMYCVLGRVANFGRVIPGSLGWRAQKSYPLELWVPYEIWKVAAPLERAYGVPVHLHNWLKPLEEQFPIGKR